MAAKCMQKECPYHLSSRGILALEQLTQLYEGFSMSLFNCDLCIAERVCYVPEVFALQVVQPKDLLILIG